MLYYLNETALKRYSVNEHCIPINSVNVKRIAENGENIINGSIWGK